MVKNIKIISRIKYWGQIFLLPLYLFSFLMPRCKKIWLFGSTFGKRFADNPKYFYLYLNQIPQDGVRAIWITKNREIMELLEKNFLEAYYLYSLKGIWYSLRGKVYIYDNYSKDICFTLSGGATKINLWHGIPLKKIQKDNIFDRVRNPRTIWERYKWAIRRISDEKPSDYVLTTSEFLRPIFSSAFQTEHVIINGYPRNDVLVSDIIENVLTEQENEFLKSLEIKSKGNKLLLYLPTFRDSEEKFFDVLNIKEFQDFLEKESMFFCAKLHPKSRLQNKFKQISSKKIMVLESWFDPYPFLRMSDMLITDYSSIYFDYLLMNKPIIFFAYDLEEYMCDSREMYFAYDEFAPGIIVNNQESLEKAIIENMICEMEIEKIKEKVFDETNTISSETLYEKIRNL